MDQQWSHGDRGSAFIRSWRHYVWHKSSWRRPPLAPPQSHWEDHPKTGEQSYQRTSCTVIKVLGPTKDSPTWGSGKGMVNSQGILLWRPMGFDYRTSTGLGKRLLKGTNKTLYAPETRRKEQRLHKRPSQTCLWVSRSLWWRCGLTEFLWGQEHWIQQPWKPWGVLA